ncbi:MAG TPA: ribbon-helix-helix domain-containing protein [Granulicella sp.]|jgi:hypothetical protein|nr:ribbon-helix-helix domain-containing protein [Granulicella sp.]
MKRNSMAQALSQAAGHAYSRPSPPENKAGDPAQGHENRSIKRLAAVAPSRTGKKPVTGFFEPEVSRQLKKAALEQDKTMQQLLQEALNDLFRKYDLPPIA